MGGYFSIQGNGTVYEAKTVILATGVDFGKPMEGEKEFLGSGVSYCATCDAFAYRGKNVAVIAYDSHAEKEAEFLKEMADKVYYFPMYDGNVKLSEKIETVRDIPIRIRGEKMVNALETEGGEICLDGVFIIRKSILPSQLVPGLEMKNNHVEVNMQMETNIEGLYACGDIVGTPYQYIKAAGQGNVAALAAVSYLS